jgi:hypothetical protein
MKFKRSTPSVNTIVAVTLFFLLSVALAACGNDLHTESGNRNHDNHEAGSVFFRVVLADDLNEAPVEARFYCGYQNDEVATVFAQITNGEHVVQPDELWDCWSGQGVISGVPVGNNYTLSIIGQNADGDTTYCAQRDGLTVNPGENHIGDVVASWFETNGREPLDEASDISPTSVTFRWEETAGATQYMLLLSEAADLSNPVLDPAPLTGDISYTISADEGLTGNTQYWWAIVPTSFDGAFGYLFPETIHTFTTAPADTPTQSVYALEYAFITYRRYESGEQRYQAIMGVSANGSGCETTDIVDWALRDGSGNKIMSTSSGLYSELYFLYNCSTGSCSLDGRLEDTGVWGFFSAIPADSYRIEIEMENGQVLGAEQHFPGQINLPFVSSDSMTAQWNNGDVELAWTNPTSDSNWDTVDQLRVLIFDDLGNSVLYMRPARDDESVTIPATLVSEAASLHGGSRLDAWQVQTRAYDNDGMNFSRAYSNIVALPAPQ